MTELPQAKASMACIVHTRKGRLNDVMMATGPIGSHVSNKDRLLVSVGADTPVRR